MDYRLEDEQEWKDNFRGHTFFSHGKSNSCGVLISFIGTQKFILNQQKNDSNGRILILDVTINDLNYILINLYNSNTEKEQIALLKELLDLLKDFSINAGKRVILAGDLN